MSENHQGRVHHRYTIEGEYTYEEEKWIDKEKLEKMCKAIEKSQKQLFSKATICLALLWVTAIAVIALMDFAEPGTHLLEIIIWG